METRIIPITINMCQMIPKDARSYQQVSLTRLLEVKGTVYTHADEVKQDAHGTLVSENTIAVYHDYYVTYHQDLNVNDTNNSFVKSTVTAIRDTGCDTPRRSYWMVRREVAEREADGEETSVLADHRPTWHSSNRVRRRGWGTTSDIGSSRPTRRCRPC
uniref:Amine oxidase n=1 Tax=Oryza brachyantha TaxID=4533 RepID=J3MR44_ORYBR